MRRVDVMVSEKLLVTARRQRNRARLLLAISLITNYFLFMMLQQSRGRHGTTQQDHLEQRAD